MTPFTLSTIPTPLHWKNTPLEWQVGPDSSLAITAGATTDWFIDPGGSVTQTNAPSALFTPPDSHFILSAKVKVDFASTFDAGVLNVYERDDCWAKLCFEYSPQQQPMVVSVVTRDFSDDCNSVVIEGREIYLRLAWNPPAFAFHYSSDGRYWHMVRYFSLGQVNNLQAGFLAQSPTGQQCRAIFSEVTYRAGVLPDLRSGA